MLKRGAKKPARIRGNEIGAPTGSKEIVPGGASLEVFEVVETQVFEEPVLGAFDEEEI